MRSVDLYKLTENPTWLDALHDALVASDMQWEQKELVEDAIHCAQLAIERINFIARQIERP